MSKGIIIAGAVLLGASLMAGISAASINSTPVKVPTIDESLPPQSVNWEDGNICILKLMAYSTKTTGSSYYLLDIRSREQVLHRINVPGRQKPIKELGAPVRTECIDVDNVRYTRHHEDKLNFVEPYDKSETNRLWGTPMDQLDKMGLR